MIRIILKNILLKGLYYYNYNNLYISIGSTLLFSFYINFLSTKANDFNVINGKKTNDSLGLSFYYNKNKVSKFLNDRDESQLKEYRIFLKKWDIYFAIIYTLMHLSWITYFYNNKKKLLIVPILSMIFDWFENFIQIIILDTYLYNKYINENLVLLGSISNSTKWIFSTITYIIILNGSKNYISVKI